MERKIVETDDGSKTLYVPELDEHYHSVFGAKSESEHIFIKAGYRSIAKKDIAIFEMGFGTGLNALLSLIESENDGRRIKYLSIEKYPLDDNIYDIIDHINLFPRKYESSIKRLYKCKWDEWSEISGRFSIMKMTADIRTFSSSIKFDLIYYDAFAPSRQPELWTFEVLEKIASITKTDGVFITYSAKGQLKRDLSRLGFMVEHLPGPPGKNHITRAVKIH